MLVDPGWRGRLFRATMRRMKQRRSDKARPPVTLSREGQRRLDEALERHQRGEIAEAIVGYRAVLAEAPKNVDALVNLGSGLTATGYPTEAAAVLGRAREAAAKLPRAQNDIGVCLFELGRYDDAIAALRAAVTLTPGYADAWKNLGCALNEAGREAEATPILQQAVLLQPLLAEGWFELFRAVFDADRPGPSVEALSRAVASNPGYAWARYCLGVALDLAGDARAAKQQFQTLARETPHLAEAVDGWRYIQERRTKETRLFVSTKRTLDLAMEQARIEGLVLEFGVRYGVSTRWIAAGSGGRTVHGFDSFEGLPEMWRDQPKGAYSTHGERPDLPPNVALHPGLFEDALPAFARDARLGEGDAGAVRFAHVDCDLYSATKVILDALAPGIRPGTVIVFDEYVVNPGWREDEHKAFREAVSSRGWQYEYLAMSPLTGQAAVRILG